jgi:hypothetical protein
MYMYGWAGVLFAAEKALTLVSHPTGFDNLD